MELSDHDSFSILNICYLFYVPLRSVVPKMSEFEYNTGFRPKYTPTKEDRARLSSHHLRRKSLRDRQI